jgi:DNA-binding transcriptional ArsR family regulator
MARAGEIMPLHGLPKWVDTDIITFTDMNMITTRTNIEQTYEAQARILKVVAHPARLAILDLLREGEQCVCHMEANLGYRQAYISQQLAVLREAGLIEDRREGWNSFYRVADPRIYLVVDAVRAITGDFPRNLILHAVACPCPKCNFS